VRPRATRPASAAALLAAAACALTYALLLLAAAPAAAADPWLSQLATKLRTNPVVVSDSVSRAISAQELEGLRAAVSAMPFRTRIAILSGPPSNFDVKGLSMFDLPELLAGAVDRPGLYIVADASDTFGTITAASAGVRPSVADDDLARAVRRDVDPEARIARQLRYALDVATTGKRPTRDSVKTPESSDDSDLSTEDIVFMTFGGGGGLAAFAIPTFLWWRRRGRGAKGAAHEQERRPPAVLDPEADVPARASNAIERLSTAIAAAQQPSDEVFELYSAASKADREARSPVDHMGALLLAQRAAALLEGREPTRRCFFDPRHRRAVTDTRWRLGDEETEVPSCRRCERALRAGRMPDTLGDRGKPYFERDSVWARTGFGTIDDELAAKVLSGR
jgi:hypothetical protein